ncbi:MAG: hypothetical protein JNM93_03310 [Bacteriovoracaceae bacterium]|nr:hypothetical protein [Bacteriovoracaceae bacterium]
MKTDYCLILSAGFGTRMRSIGQRIPKPMWPVFEKTIIELQIDYARMLGCKEIFVNLHHMTEEVLNYFHHKEEYEDIHFLIEKEILDIGGAIHNLAQRDFVNYKGSLMINNGDQFLFFDWKKLKEIEKHFSNYKAVLMAVKVDPIWGHGQTLLDKDDHLSKIIPNKEITSQDSIYTYSGLGFIDLAKLKPSKGKSSLYDSVVTYKTDPIKMVKVDEYEYWDFGTIDRYWHSLFQILIDEKVKKESSFIEFLHEKGAINQASLNLEKLSYNADKFSINLSSQAWSSSKPGQIVLASRHKAVSAEGPGVICGELFEKVESKIKFP